MAMHKTAKRLLKEVRNANAGRSIRSVVFSAEDVESGFLWDLFPSKKVAGIKYSFMPSSNFRSVGVREFPLHSVPWGHDTHGGVSNVILEQVSNALKDEGYSVTVRVNPDYPPHYADFNLT